MREYANLDLRRTIWLEEDYERDWVMLWRMELREEKEYWERYENIILAECDEIWYWSWWYREADKEIEKKRRYQRNGIVAKDPKVIKKKRRIVVIMSNPLEEYWYGEESKDTVSYWTRYVRNSLGRSMARRKIYEPSPSWENSVRALEDAS